MTKYSPGVAVFIRDATSLAPCISACRARFLIVWFANNSHQSSIRIYHCDRLHRRPRRPAGRSRKTLVPSRVPIRVRDPWLPSYSVPPLRGSRSGRLPVALAAVLSVQSDLVAQCPTLVASPSASLFCISIAAPKKNSIRPGKVHGNSGTRHQKNAAPTRLQTTALT